MKKLLSRNSNKENPLDFDDCNGDYKLIVGEHICYRYEIIDR